MDFIWKPAFEGVSGPKNDTSHKGLFTHLMYNTYIVPCGIPMTNYWNKQDAGLLRQWFMGNLTSNETFAAEFTQCWEEVA
jgi:hypothetical protein